MGKFSLRYVLVEVAALALVLGTFRGLSVLGSDSPHQDLLVFLLVMAAGGAIGGLSGRIGGILVGAMLLPPAMFVIGPAVSFVVIAMFLVTLHQQSKATRIKQA